MKQLKTLCLCLAAALLLSACRAASVPAAGPAPTEPPASTAAVSVPPADTSEPAEAPVFTDREALLLAYQKILQGIARDNVWPDGTPTGFDGDGSDMSRNTFALFDLDMDGNDELIVSFTTTAVAGMAEAVYHYDGSSGKTAEILREFPPIAYHPGGVAIAPRSHAQGLCGDLFWPCTMYRYSEAAGRYLETAQIDAWEKDYMPTDYDGNPFPDALDKDGAGILYYVTENGKTTTLTKSEYTLWYSGAVGDPQPIRLPFWPMTDANIASVATGGPVPGPAIPPDELPYQKAVLELGRYGFTDHGQRIDAYACLNNHSLMFFRDEAQEMSVAVMSLPDNLLDAVTADCRLEVVEPGQTGDSSSVGLELTFPNHSTVYLFWDYADGAYSLNHSLSHY